MSAHTASTVTLFVCGDVMTGRGIDQILPRPSHPRLFESYMDSAVDYVTLAEQRNGPIPRAVAPDYIWGEALALLEREAPALRLINLETAITTHDAPAPKGINYRMHPANITCLTAARLDGAVLANNHVLDWGQAGLTETLTRLRGASIATVGAGRDRAEAQVPACWPLPGGGRLLLYAWAHGSSGVPAGWAAGAGPGVNYLPDLSATTVATLAQAINDGKRPGDIVVVSLHWGDNWGYAIAAEQRRFACALIDSASVDMVWGHSSHHPRPMEVHAGKLILYGCGDFLNDYEGISGHEEYRPELVAMYLPTLDSRDGRLLQLRLIPFRLRRFRLERASSAETGWMAVRLSRESETLGSRLAIQADGSLLLHW